MVETREFDFANYLDSEEAIVEFIKAAVEPGDPAVLEATMAEARRAAERIGLPAKGIDSFVEAARKGDEPKYVPFESEEEVMEFADAMFEQAMSDEDEWV